MNISSILLHIQPDYKKEIETDLLLTKEIQIEKSLEDRLALTLESPDLNRSTEIWAYLERLEGVESVTMAYCHFDDLVEEKKSASFLEKEVTRREFIRKTAAAAALAILFGQLATKGHAASAESSNGLEVGSDSSVNWQKGVCRFCGVGCGVMLGTRGGRVVAIQGDKKSPVNKGLLCVKGYYSPKILYGDDRLTKPLVRKNGKMVPVSWDEALDLVASKFKGLVDQHGPDAVSMYGSGQWTIQEGYAALKFMKGGIGTNNLEANARLCMASAVTGFMTSFGSDEPMGCYDDLDIADTFFFWGNNSAEMHPILFSRIVDRRSKGDDITLIDLATRKTRTTHLSDIHVSMNPQSDLALANSIAHIIIRDKKWDPEFVKKHVVFKKGKTNIGYVLEDNFKFKDKPQLIEFDEYKEFLKDYAPEKVASLIGTTPEQIEGLANYFKDSKKKIVSLWCMGVNQHTRGTWMNNLIYNLHLLTGQICKPGSTALSLTGQPSACGTVREVGVVTNRLPSAHVVTNPKHREKVAKMWGVPVEKISPTPTYHAVEMFRALGRGDVKAMWISTTNPFQTIPNLERFEKGLKKNKPFIVVSDVYPTASTKFADVILPSSLWVEKEGCFGNTERRTQFFPKMVDPPGDAKSDVWQIVEVAKRMGYGKLFQFNPDKLEEEIFEEYRTFTLGTGKDVGPYELYQKERGLRWPVIDGKETKYRYVEGEDPYVKPGEGIKFYKNKKDNGRAVIWARPYEPPAEVPDKEYPFWLCTGRVLEHWHTGTLTRRVPELHKSVPEAYVEIHPLDAEKQGIVSGDKVRLISRRGHLELTADVSYSGRALSQRGMVFVPFFDEAKLINFVTLDSMCPISKEPDYKKCAIKIEKV